MGNLLTREEIIELTGTPLKSRQCQVLDTNRIPYVLRADGRPSVTWDAVNAKLGGKQQKSATPMNAEGFNLEAARG